MNLGEPFIHPQATVIGLVELSLGCSIWPQAVLRGDMNYIRLGKGINVQDGSVIHTDSGREVIIGDFSLIGHRAILHGCKIGKAVLIGTAATVHDEAEIGDGAMVMAHCVIRGKKKIPPHALVLPNGNGVKIFPGKANTILTLMGSLEYLALSERYQKGIFRPFTIEEQKEFEEKARSLYERLFSTENYHL